MVIPTTVPFIFISTEMSSELDGLDGYLWVILLVEFTVQLHLSYIVNVI